MHFNFDVVYNGVLHSTVPRNFFSNSPNAWPPRNPSSNSTNRDCVGVVDYGVADGLNTQQIYADVVSKLDVGESQKKLRLHLVDLPSNDWDTVAEVCTQAGLTDKAVADTLQEAGMIPGSSK